MRVAAPPVPGVAQALLDVRVPRLPLHHPLDLRRVRPDLHRPWAVSFGLHGRKRYRDGAAALPRSLFVLLTSG